jgi:AcrR family transcriptional regulator
MPTDADLSTSDRILDAASMLMADRGYAATSISALAKEADVRPASIYWAFGSKEGVLAAVVDRSSQRWLGEHGPSIRSAATLDLWEGIRSLAPLFAQQPEFLRLLLVLSLERRDGDPAVIASARRIRSQVVDGLVEMFLPSIEVDDDAARRLVALDLSRLLVMLLDGSFISGQIDESDPDETFALIADALRGTLEQRVAQLRATPSPSPNHRHGSRP